MYRYIYVYTRICVCLTHSALASLVMLHLLFSRSKVQASQLVRPNVSHLTQLRGVWKVLPKLLHMLPVSSIFLNHSCVGL